MKIFTRLGFARTTALLWLVAAIGFFGARLWAPLVVLGLPFSIPGFLVLGADETQERFGYWGEPLYFSLLSLPCALLYAWVFDRWGRLGAGAFGRKGR